LHLPPASRENKPHPEVPYFAWRLLVAAMFLHCWMRQVMLLPHFIYFSGDRRFVHCRTHNAISLASLYGWSKSLVYRSFFKYRSLTMIYSQFGLLIEFVDYSLAFLATRSCKRRKNSIFRFPRFFCVILRVAIRGPRSRSLRECQYIF
jgi:hypothetical protein